MAETCLSRTDVVVFGLSSDGDELLTSQEMLKFVSLSYTHSHTLCSLSFSVFSANVNVFGDAYTITNVTVSIQDE